MKKLIVLLVVVSVLLIPVGVYAATSDTEVAQSVRNFCGFGVDTTELTEEQKADLEESFDQMIEVRRESINKMIENGLLTEEEGEEALERLEEMVEYQQENGFVMGQGMMNGFGRGRGNVAGGAGNNCGNGCGRIGAN